MKQIILSVFISFPVLLSAQISTENRFSLSDCFKLADANNLSLQAARMDVDKARLMEGTAWDFDKTDVTLSQDPTSGGSPDNALSLSQTIDFPTHYSARRRQLKSETNMRQSEVAVIGNRLHGQVASLYYQLVYEKEKLRILQSQDSMLSNYENIATKRYNAGEVRQLEPLNASRLRHENQLAMNLAQTEYANTQAELARLLGVDTLSISPDTPFGSSVRGSGEVTDIKTEGSQVFNIVTLSLPRTGELEGGAEVWQQFADARLRVADEAIKVERTGFLPSLTLALRTQMVIKGWNPYHVDRGWNDGNFMGFEIGVGIPIFNGATRARVKAARKEREQLSLQIKNEVQLRKNQYLTATNNMLAARRQLDYYSKTGNVDAEKTARISAMAYENGEISYIEYVAALQQSIDTQLKYASAVNDYNQAAIKLKTLAGTMR